MRSLFLVVLVSWSLPLAEAEPQPDKPLSPAEARNRVNERVLVEMLVRASKNRMEKRKEIYLDSEEDFRDPKNLGIVVTLAGAEKYKEAGIPDPAEHFKGKTIRVTGTVILKDDRPRTEVDDTKQIQLIERK